MLQRAHVVTYMGCVGNDDLGAALRTYAEKDGVRVEYLVDQKEPTGTCAVLLSKGHR